MIDQSSIYTFLDKENNVLIHFGNGEKLISDLAMSGQGTHPQFSTLRDFVLYSSTLISLLKHGEEMGVYVDGVNGEPSLKLECHSSGKMRATIFYKPNEHLKKCTGRFLKMSPKMKVPFTSLVDVGDHGGLEAIFDEFYGKSFQIQGKVFLGQKTDHVLFVTKIPQESDHFSSEDISLNKYLFKNQLYLLEILENQIEKESQINESFKNKFGVEYLSSKKIELGCFCNKNKFISQLKSLGLKEKNEIFEEGTFENIEIVCEYCQKKYNITKNEVLGSPN